MIFARQMRRRPLDRSYSAHGRPSLKGWSLFYASWRHADLAGMECTCRNQASSIDNYNRALMGTPWLPNQVQARFPLKLWVKSQSGQAYVDCYTDH